MFVSRVELDLLDTERLEPSFYSPEFRAAFVAVTALPNEPVGDLCHLWSFGAFALYSEIVWTECGGGYPFVRMDCFEPPFIDWDSVAWVTPASHALVHKSHALDGDVLVSVSGTIGKVGIVRNSPTPVVSTNQHTMKLRSKSAKALDPEYLSAYLMTAPAQTLLFREAGGAVQKEIYLYNFGRLRVSTPNEAVQRYIGSKVRQAQALRERARAWTDSAFRVVLDLFPGLSSHEDLPKRSGRITPHLLVDRLNADAYSSDHLRDVDTLRVAGLPLRPLGEFVIAPINNSIRGVTEAFAELDGKVPMFRPADISGLWLSTETAPKLPPSFEAEHIKSRVFPGDIVLAIAGTIGVAGRVPPTVAYGNVNGSSARLRPSEEMRGYLLVLLNTPLGLRLTTRWAVGAVQKHVNLEDLPGILLPVAPANVLAVVNDLVSKAEMAYLTQRQLVSAARLLVEALIERKVTEAELIAASAEPAADRALLARLTRAGLDAPGEPLFFDLDTLVALLKLEAS